MKFPLQIKLPGLLLSMVILAYLLGPLIPVFVKSFLFAFSLSIKEVLIFVLPALVFVFVFNSMVGLGKQAFRFVMLLLPLICVSSFLGVGLAYGVGRLFIPQNSLVVLSGSEIELAPLWVFHLPQWISNDYALLMGCILGLLASLRAPDWAGQLSRKAMNSAHAVLSKGLLPMMPLFILGFTLKLEQDRVLGHIAKDYLPIFLLIVLSTYSYLFVLYGALNRFEWSLWFRSIQNMLPAMVAAFSTMSSAASMPLTILGTESNVSRPELARAVIPATVNIHLVGDCFATPLFALAILLSFGYPMPNLAVYAVFAGYFVLAKFAVAGVPGGGIIVMLPVLEQHLGFTAPMLSLITALYILFDSFITAANVSGNGALAVLFSKFFNTAFFGIFMLYVSN